MARKKTRTAKKATRTASKTTRKSKPKSKKWAQKVTAGMKRRGTEGDFRAWAKRHGYKSGSDPAAIAAGLRSKDKRVQKMAQAAKGFATIRRKRKSQKK